MSDPAAVVEAAAELERGAHLMLVGSKEWLAAHPPTALVRPTGLPGWVAFVAAGAYFLGTIPTRPEGTPDNLVTAYRDVAGNLRRQIEFLETHELTPEQLRLQLEGIRLSVDAVRRLRLALERVPRILELAQELPARVLGLLPQPLRQIVTYFETWRQGHHVQVHKPLARAEAAEAGAQLAVASVTAGSLAAVADAIRAVVTHFLPQLRRELGRLVHEEAQARRDADRELAERLRERIGDLTERIGDLVRWLRTEALPELREQLRAEREARREAERDIRQNTERNLRRLEETDQDLMRALGPLLGPGLAPVLNAGRKVARTEGMFDQLLRSGDLNWAAQLLVAGPFVAIVTRILEKVAGQIPEALSGLEDAAVRALGSVD